MSCKDSNGTVFLDQTIVCANGTFRLKCNGTEWVPEPGHCRPEDPRAVFSDDHLNALRSRLQQ